MRESLLALSDTALGGMSGGDGVRARLKKLLDTVTYVLGRMSARDGCVALGVLSAGLRRALASPTHGCELSAEELSLLLTTTGGELLLEDCGFQKHERAAVREADAEGLGRVSAPSRVFGPRGGVSGKASSGGRAAGASRRPASPQRSALGKASKPKGLNEVESSLWAAFELADKNGNGSLSQDEFTAALKATGLATSDADAQKEWRSADADRSGAIDFKEFCKLGKRKKALASLPAKIAANPKKVEQAAEVIQRRLRQRVSAAGGAAAAGKAAASERGGAAASFLSSAAVSSSPPSSSSRVSPPASPTLTRSYGAPSTPS